MFIINDIFFACCLKQRKIFHQKPFLDSTDKKIRYQYKYSQKISLWISTNRIKDHTRHDIPVQSKERILSYIMYIPEQVLHIPSSETHDYVVLLLIVSKSK